MIISLDIGGGEHRHDLRVVAVHNSLATEVGDVLPSIAAAHGGQIPATEFRIHDVDPYQILRVITQV